MVLENNTTQAQRAFGLYTRTGKRKPKSTKDNNINHYHRLVLNNVTDIIASTFSLTQDYVGEARFTKLIKDFFATTPCISPQFWQMPKEFFEYIKYTQEELSLEFPPLINLMEMEWTEIELFMMPDERMPPFSDTGDVFKDKLVMNPECRILPLNYPVYHKKASEIQPSDYSQYFVSLHRNISDKQINQTDLGLIQVEALLQLNEQPDTAESIFQTIHTNPNYQNYSFEEFIEFCKFCIETELIMGYQKLNF